VSDLHARETNPPDWEGPVIELVEDGHMVGRVYLDAGTPLTELSADDWVFEVDDLQRVLDTALAMLGVAEEEQPSGGSDHPVDTLAAEFDEFAVRRGDEDEGFYKPTAVAALIARCEASDLAVVSIEGFRDSAGKLTPVPGLDFDIGEAHSGEAWPTFKAGCNVQAAAVLERWANEPGVLLAIEVGDRQGERFVL
jgi:hypothetical protein